MGAHQNVLESIISDSLAPQGGRKAGGPISMTILRHLTQADLDFKASAGPSGVPIQPLVKLRYTHHLLARLVASGKKIYEIAQITGYSPGRISDLKENDPAFRELVAYYHGQAEKEYLDVHARLAAVGMLALDEIQERLTDEPHKVKMMELKDILETVMDRSIAPSKGAGKGMGQAAPGGVNITVSFTQPAQEPTGVTIDQEPQG